MDTLVPKLSSVSGPAKVSFDADNILFMVKDDGDQRGESVKLLPAKLRDGDMGRAPITLYKHKSIPKFENISKNVQQSDLETRKDLA